MELAALRDAADEESSAWGSDAGAYLAVLTLFAVALYLFGFSLVQHARLPRVFVGAGLVLLATGVMWAAASYATKTQRAPPAAAAEFAAGHVALKNAYQPHEYRRAAAHFTRAIRLRPSFARAYFESGTAHYLAGSPQAAGPAGITTAEAHERSIQDMLKAQELGLYTPELLTSLGFSRFVVGLEQRDDDLLERSILLAREAVDAAVERRQDTDAIPHYNLAVALLAAGRIDDAQAAYATAVRKTSSDFFRQQTVAGALTDLQLVVENTSDPVAAAARRLKGFVVASALKDQFTGDSEHTPVDVHVRSTPGGLQLRNRGGSDPPLCNRDLVAVWYRTPGPGLGSYVPAESLTGSFRQCIPGLRNSVAESHLAASFPAECLPDGSYRLELYDGSNVVAERRLRTRWRSAAGDARDIGVRLCRPDGWMTWRGSQPSLDTAVISPDGERGIVVVRLSGSVAHRHHARVLATLLQRYRRLVGATADGGADARRAFMDIPRATTRQYVAGSKRILAGIGSDADGSTVAAFVFSPRRWFGGTTPNPLFDSLALAYQPI